MTRILNAINELYCAAIDTLNNRSNRVQSILVISWLIAIEAISLSGKLVDADMLAYLMSSILLIFSFYYSSNGHYRLSGMAVLISFISFALAQLHKGRLFIIFGDLSNEQILCWFFGGLYFVLACYFVHRDSLKYAFAIFIISVVACFCGLSSVQGLLKSDILLRLDESLEKYGEKLDEYQKAVGKMKAELVNKQTALDAKLSETFALYKNQTNELSKMQLRVEGYESNCIINITTNVNTFNTNLAAEKARLTNVVSLVDMLYSNTVIENIDCGDTNNVAIVISGSTKRLFVRLSCNPISYSILGVVIQNEKHFQNVLLPDYGQILRFKNIISINIDSRFDEQKCSMLFRYLKDPRNIETCTNMLQINTNIIKFNSDTVSLHD